MILKAVVLGIVQGLAEFLPISSSAHLILARAFFGWDGDQFGLPFDVALHVGTLLAILVYFRDDLLRMLGAVPDMFSRNATGPARMAWLVVIGTIPVVIIGLLLRNLEDAIRSPIVAGCTLALGGVLLLVAEGVGSRTREAESLSAGEALGLGTAQSAALIPGVSRSGATITVGLFVGLRRDAAARFSFLLGVPAISAAAAHEGLKLLREPLAPGAAPLFLTGMVVSAAVGYLTIKYFLRYLASHSLAVFAWYRLALAACVAVWWLHGRG